MKRNEFLKELREALEHDLSAEDLKKNLDYYDEYIREEMKKGQSEEEVVDALGDPWVIAKTVRTSANMGIPEYTSAPEKEAQEERTDQKGRITRILWALTIGLILLTILCASFGIIAIVIRYAFPIILILVLIRMFTKK